MKACTLGRLVFWGAVAVAVSMPVDPTLMVSRAKAANVWIGFFIIAALAFRFAGSGKWQWRNFLIFTGLFLVYLLMLPRADNFPAALRELFETKVGLLLIPVAFFSAPRFSNQEIRLILLGFAWACALAAGYCLIRGVMHFYHSGQIGFPTHHDLGAYVNMHAIYLAMYNVFGVLIFFWAYLNHWFEISNTKRVLAFLAILVLVSSIILLSARLHIAMLFLLVVGYAGYRTSGFLSWKWSLGISTIVGLVLVAVTFSVPQNLERFKQVVNYQNRYSASTGWGEQQIRGQIWQCAWELISRKPLFGYGTANAQPELDQCYLQKDFKTLFFFEGAKYNAHNQYMEIWLETGLAGAFAFALLLGLCLYLAWSTRNRLYLAFLVLFALSCMTESMLERHHGIIFFTFFNALFFVHANYAYEKKYPSSTEPLIRLLFGNEHVQDVKSREQKGM